MWKERVYKNVSASPKIILLIFLPSDRMIKGILLLTCLSVFLLSIQTSAVIFDILSSDIKLCVFDGDLYAMKIKFFKIYVKSSFLCRLRSIAAHRDHFVRHRSVRPSFCLSGSHTFLVVMHCYISQTTCIPTNAAPIFWTVLMLGAYRSVSQIHLVQSSHVGW